MITATSTSSLVESSEQDSDRKLLKALFEGDNISSVFDHNYLDPTAMKSSSKFSEQAQQVCIITVCCSTVCMNVCIYLYEYMYLTQNF